VVNVYCTSAPYAEASSRLAISSGVLGLILIIVIVLWLMGRI
jgi:hypothetical protein